MSDRPLSSPRIQILGSDGPEGQALAGNVRAALQQLGIAGSVELVSDMDVITSFQVMVTPALVVDGRVRLVGRVPEPDELRRMLGGRNDE